MITKEVTKQSTGEYGVTLHLKTIYRVFGMTVYTITTTNK